MRRRAVLSLYAVIALSGCAHQGPYVAGDMRWSLNQVDGEGVKLAFGQPQSDNVVLMMSCQPRSGEVMVMVSGAGSPALELASGRAKTSRTGQVGPSGVGDGAVVEATLPAHDPVLDSFARTGSLTVTAAGRKTALPAAPKVEAGRFVESCRA